MGRAFDAALELRPQPSGAARIVNHLLLVAAVLLLLWLAIHTQLFLLLLPIVMAFWIHANRQIGYRGRNHVSRLIWRQDGTWRVELDDGSVCDLTLLQDTVVLRWLICLQLGCKQGRRRICLYLPFDSLPPDQHRRLRARLRFARLETPVAKNAGKPSISGGRH